jgi:hypothetical protein
MPRELGQRLLRCLHTDNDRPAHETDRYEFHWRCTAVFQCNEDEPPFCPYHRPIYTHRGDAPRGGAEQAERAIERYQREVSARSERLARPAREDDGLTYEDMERLRVRRDEQLSRAHEKGVL